MDGRTENGTWRVVVVEGSSTLHGVDFRTGVNVCDGAGTERLECERLPELVGGVVGVLGPDDRKEGKKVRCLWQVFRFIECDLHMSIGCSVAKSLIGS